MWPSMRRLPIAAILVICIVGILVIALNTMTVNDDETEVFVLPVLGTAVPGTLRVAVIGDYGDAASAAEADVANLVKSWAPDLIITTGDNNYPDGEAATIDANIGQYYHEFLHPYRGAYGPGADVNRFFPSLGNHDWRTRSGSPAVPQPHLDYFSLPTGQGAERYYDFVWGPIHFFAVDSDKFEPDGTSSTSLQAQWLQATMSASTSPWKLVYMHHPPFSSSSSHGSTPRMQWPYAAWGATAVLAGHDHTYERILKDGIVYFVNGLGGRSIYRLGSPVAGSEVQYNGDYGAMLIEADDLSITFRFLNRFGAEIDSYTIAAATQSVAPTVVPAPLPARARSATVDHRSIDNATEALDEAGMGLTAQSE